MELERFFSKVEINDCWDWTAAKDNDGYGKFWSGGGVEEGWLMMAHRYCYEQLVGPIPERMTCDHLCKNRGCVNPEHIELVTVGENTRRGYRNGKKRCSEGHSMANPYIQPSTGQRSCLICRRANAREYARKRRAT